jgi:hypothetical protein
MQRNFQREYSGTRKNNIKIQTKIKTRGDAAEETVRIRAGDAPDRVPLATKSIFKSHLKLHKCHERLRSRHGYGIMLPLVGFLSGAAQVSYHHVQPASFSHGYSGYKIALSEASVSALGSLGS